MQEEQKDQEQQPAVTSSNKENTERVEDVNVEVQSEAPNTGTPEEKLPRDIFFERIRTNVPDGKFEEDEQEYFRHAMQMLDAAEEGSKKYQGMNEKLMRRYKEDPEEVAILMDYIEGTPLIDAIVKHKGEEALHMKEGDEGWDSYQQAVEKRKTDRAKYMELMNEVENNMKGTIEEFNTWAEENGFDDEQRAKVWELIQGDLENISKGKFTKEILGRYRDALNYQKDVDGAREQGRAEAKNEAIEAKRKQMKGSGLPATDAHSVQEPEQQKPNGTATFLDRMRKM